jgi:hypothetical protein
VLKARDRGLQLLTNSLLGTGYCFKIPSIKDDLLRANPEITTPAIRRAICRAARRLAVRIAHDRSVHANADAMVKRSSTCAAKARRTAFYSHSRRALKCA